MRHKIYPAARRRIIEIWHYTDKTWGEKQADNYVRGLHQAIEKAPTFLCSLAFDGVACGNGRGGIKRFYSYMPEIWGHRTLLAVCSQ